MSYFKINMYYIRFRLGLCLRPHRSPYLLAGFKDPTSREEERKKRRGRRGGAIFSPNISLKSTPLCKSMTQTYSSRSSDLIIIIVIIVIVIIIHSF